MPDPTPDHTIRVAINYNYLMELATEKRIAWNKLMQCSEYEQRNQLRITYNDACDRLDAYCTNCMLESMGLT